MPFNGNIDDYVDDLARNGQGGELPNFDPDA